MSFDLAVLVKPFTDLLNKLRRDKDQVQQKHDDLFNLMLTIEEQLGKFIQNQSMNEDILKEAINKSKQNLEFLYSMNKVLKKSYTSVLYENTLRLLNTLQEYLILEKNGNYKNLAVYHETCKQITSKFRNYTMTYSLESDHESQEKSISEFYYQKRYFLIISLSVMLLAASSNLFIFFKIKNNLFISQFFKINEIPKPPIQACSSEPIRDIEALEKSRQMIIRNSKSNFFQVLENELQEESNTRLSIHSNNPSLLREVIKYMHKYIIDNENTVNTNRANIFSRYLPLVRILENNASIDNIQPSPLKINIAVALSLSNIPGAVRGPDPPAISLLRGVDTAQRFIIKYNEQEKPSHPVFIKILIIDDTNSNAERFYPADEISNLTKYLTDDFTPITALIGHSDTWRSAKHYPCYKSNNLPIFSGSILHGKESSSIDTPSLLPSSNQIATNMIRFIRMRRNDQSLSDLPSKLIIYYDSKDLSSISFKEEICQAFRREAFQAKGICEPIDIRELVLLPSDKPLESELVLALNPNRNPFKDETKSILRSRIAAFMQTQYSEPTNIWLYVGPDYYDQNLIDSLQKFMNLELSTKKKNLRFSIFRIAPPDWRTKQNNSIENPLINNEYQEYYGPKHNWNGYNGFNSLVSFWQMITDLNPSTNLSPNLVSKLRKNIIKIQDNVTLRYTRPGVLILNRLNTGYTLQGPGNKICEAAIIEVSANPVKTYGCEIPN
jgi:hypothetical protein